jgi:primosomal protein N' (replication factor Y) (superfamily II helicase)
VTPAVARVLPDVPALDRPFDYDAAGLEPPLGIGDRVRVSLHGRSVRGWVLELGGSPSAELELKPISRRLGLGPTPEVVELCGWAAWRWAGPRCKLLGTASPERIVTELPAVPPSALPEVHNQARVAGARLVRHRTATLVRLGPCMDPIDLVLGMLRGVEEAGAVGTFLVLTPTTGWAERLAERLRRRGVAAAGPDRWAEARAGFRVVVGARAAALAPVPRLASALVLDAHDGAYRQSQTPCWNAVALLAERCRRDGVSLVATSWCPSPSIGSLFGATEATEHESRFWPRLVVADLRESDPRERTLTSSFAVAAHHALDERGNGPKVVVVLQRLGGVRLLACQACGSLAVCEPHHEPLHEVTGALGCARGCTQHPRVCVTCGRGPLRAVREGITALTKRVSALLQTEATEVSAATSSIDPAARVLVGTEAVLTRVRGARLVCFADLDDYLGAPRAHSSLEALRAIGMAGRLVGARGSDAPGHVFVQTRQPHHRAVEAAVHGSPEAVVAEELELARTLALPPFVAMCALRGEGAPQLASSLRSVHLEVREDDGGFVAIAPTHEALCDALASVDRPAAPVRIDVDPPDQ